MTEIISCRSRSDFVIFERCAEVLHGNEKCFVPPFPGSVAGVFKPTSPFCKRHGEIWGLLARRDGRLVGRIAAIRNHSHNSYSGDKTGFFGFFACEDNEETAALLFNTVEKILTERGCNSVRGPYSPSINDECGLLVEGFENVPRVGYVWNPPYYQHLVERCGFSRLVGLVSSDLPLHKLPLPMRLAPIAERCRRQSAMKLRMIDLSRLTEELTVIGEVYNGALDGNMGFYPITKDDLAHAAHELAPVVRRECILIAEQNGERVGVTIVIPDINELLIHLRKTPHWLRLLHFLWLLKTRTIRYGRQIVYGIAPKFRHKGGLHGWLVYEHFDEVRKVFDGVELGWVQEDNDDIINIGKIIGATLLNRWNIYEKPLDK